MDKGTVKEIVDTWMIPTPGAAYMAGLEDRPVLATAHGSTVVDTTGRPLQLLDPQRLVRRALELVTSSLEGGS